MLEKGNHGTVRSFLWLIVILAIGLVLASCTSEQALGNELNEAERDPAEEQAESGELELLTELPEAGVALYAGKGDGVVLYWGDEVSTFDWPYMTPRGIMPRIYVDDHDGDGEQELAIILYIGSGAGISVEELHIVEKTAAGLEDYVFDQESYERQLRDEVTLELFPSEEQLVGKLVIGERVYEAVMPFDDFDDFDAVSDYVVLGNRVSFEWSEEGIQAVFGAGVHKENTVDIRYFGDLYGDVLYRDGKFELDNLRFEANSL